MIDDSALALIGMVLFLSAAYLSLAPDAPKPLAVANWLALAALAFSVVMGGGDMIRNCSFCSRAFVFSEEQEPEWRPGWLCPTCQIARASVPADVLAQPSAVDEITATFKDVMAHILVIADDLAAATQRNAELERARDFARRHIELLNEQLDAVPVVALDALLDDADDVPANVTEWLAWATLGALWQPAEQPCPDCGADALVVAIHADGTIEQWLCQECGYVAAEKSEVQP
jgi:ribosomal protein S27AE